MATSGVRSNVSYQCSETFCTYSFVTREVPAGCEYGIRGVAYGPTNITATDVGAKCKNMMNTSDEPMDQMITELVAGRSEVR